MSIAVGVKGSEDADGPTEMKDEEQGGPEEESLLQAADPDVELNLPEVIELTANTIPAGG